LLYFAFSRTNLRSVVGYKNIVKAHVTPVGVPDAEKKQLPKIMCCFLSNRLEFLYET